MTENGASSTARRWTEAQRLAIEHPGGDLLISAAAGSGKTAVLAERCARLVCAAPVEGVAPTGVENLLVLTFTEAAAAEMRTRIGEALRARLRDRTLAGHRWLRRQLAMIDRAGISTLHAFCMRTLRQHFHEAAVDPGFEIMDEEEARLLRDEVLDELIVRWHKLPETAETGLNAGRFTAFFEDYAQGRELSLREMILKTHRMLASTADPAAYVAAARRTYGDNAEETLRRFSSQTLMQRVRRVRIKAQRARDEVAAVPEAGAMRAGLDAALGALDEAAEMLADGAAVWGKIREMVGYKWPVCKSLKEMDDFEGFKKRTWEAVKDAMKDLAAEFAGDGAVMLRELRELAVPLETLLALTVEFQEAFTTAKRGVVAEGEERGSGGGARLDFADLERLALDLLTRPGSLAAAELRQKYHHVLVDEFQDINPLQAALLEAIRDPARFNNGGNLFAVGDIKQSIYAFRLAQPELFLRREREARAFDATRGAGDTEGARKFIALQHNFRSQAKLLEVMNRIFERIITPEVVGLDYSQGHELKAGNVGAGGETEGLAMLDGRPVELHLAAMDGESEEEGGRAGRGGGGGGGESVGDGGGSGDGGGADCGG